MPTKAEIQDSLERTFRMLGAAVRAGQRIGAAASPPEAELELRQLPSPEPQAAPLPPKRIAVVPTAPPMSEAMQEAQEAYRKASAAAAAAVEAAKAAKERVDALAAAEAAEATRIAEDAAEDAEIAEAIRRIKAARAARSRAKPQQPLPRLEPPPAEAEPEAEPEFELEPEAEADQKHKVSAKGIAAVKKHEGFYPKAYWDYAQYSIGHGTRAASANETITPEEADAALRRELRICELWLDDNITTPLSQNQIDALCSFGYNLGTDDLDRLADDINADEFERVATRMLSFNRAGGEVLQGLVNRRQAESEMFLAP